MFLEHEEDNTFHKKYGQWIIRSREFSINNKRGFRLPAQRGPNGTHTPCIKAHKAPGLFNHAMPTLRLRCQQWRNPHNVREVRFLRTPDISLKRSQHLSHTCITSRSAPHTANTNRQCLSPLLHETVAALEFCPAQRSVCWNSESTFLAGHNRTQ